MRLCNSTVGKHQSTRLTNEMSVPDLLGGNEVDKFSKLTWSAAVNTQHTLLMSSDAVKLQRNFVPGVSTDHQHAALQTPIICHTAIARTTSTPPCKHQSSVILLLLNTQACFVDD